jgi:hypothetical protein
VVTKEGRITYADVGLRNDETESEMGRLLTLRLISSINVTC